MAKLGLTPHDDAGDGEGYFKAAQSAAKRLEKLLNAANKAGMETSRIEAELERMRLTAASLVFEGIAEVKSHPDFLIDDRLVRAAAHAEVLTQKARQALDGRKPWLKSMKAYRKAFLRLVPYR